jgi:hypothetical protein
LKMKEVTVVTTLKGSQDAVQLTRFWEEWKRGKTNNDQYISIMFPAAAAIVVVNSSSRRRIGLLITFRVSNNNREHMFYPLLVLSIPAILVMFLTVIFTGLFLRYSFFVFL